MTDSMRVYVNAVPVDVPVGGTALDAVRIWNAAAADAVAAGDRMLTDSRGLPIAADAPLSNGTVLRLISNRVRDDADPAARFEE